MAYDEQDAAHDAYVADCKDELDALLEGLGRFWVAHARLLQAAGMVITGYLSIPDDRRNEFGELFLDDLSAHRAARVVKRIIASREAEEYEDLPKKLRRIGNLRNRLAHDALDLQVETGAGYPELTRKSLFGSEKASPVTADELEEGIASCGSLEDRLLGLLAWVNKA